MMRRLHQLYDRLQASLWFLPTLMVLGHLGLALGLIELNGWPGSSLADDWPRLFGAGADGSRSMLSAIATSMITVAGVVFSITIVALSLASSQYSPRVLANFMRDRPTQLVLGTFLGIFAYCLVVLRTVRSSDEGDGFVPSLAVLAGVGLALVGIAVLIYYIHHVAWSIQVSSILQRIAWDTGRAIDRLFPSPLGNEIPPSEIAPQTLPAMWVAIAAPASGYLVSVQEQALPALAARQGRVIRLERCVGDFVVEGVPLISFAGSEPVPKAACKEVLALFDFGPQRTVFQDAPYGVQQLVDVALKALSPGINDPTTACMCVDHLGALLAKLAGRHIPGPCRSESGQLRVIAPGPDFKTLVADGFGPIIRHAGAQVSVLQRLLGALDMVGSTPCDESRRRVLASWVERIEGQLGSKDMAEADRRMLAVGAEGLRLRLLGRSALPDGPGLNAWGMPPQQADGLSSPGRR